MKKSIIMGLIGVGSLLTLTQGVKAETLDLTNISETGQTVTVGEVDAPVYSVDIVWGDLTFDYKYNQVTNDYYWQEKTKCIKLEEDEYGFNKLSYDNRELDIYWDEACEQEKTYDQTFEGAVSNNTYYAISDYDKDAGTIQIHDNSTNAQIIPSISWTSEAEYNFVKGNLQYEGPILTSCALVETEEEFNYLKDSFMDFYNDSSCSTKLEAGNIEFSENAIYYNSAGGTGWKDLISTTLPEEARQQGAGGGITSGWYYIKLSLYNDSSKEAKMPTAGDKIGTVTISIDAK